MTEPKQIALGADIVLILVKALEMMPDGDRVAAGIKSEEEFRAIRDLLWNADLVVLHIGMPMPCSLAERAKEGK